MPGNETRIEVQCKRAMIATRRDSIKNCHDQMIKELRFAIIPIMLLSG
jgi:hypothetical protein